MVKVNISYLDTGVDLTIKKNMYRTGIYTDFNTNKIVVPSFKNTDISFDRLHEITSKSSVQYSPYIFTNDGTRLSRNWNNNQQNILVFDIDDGMSIEQARDKFKKFTYLIVTTRNHQKDKKGIICDRYRVILPATNIPKGEIYFEMLEVMSKEIPMDIQCNTKTGCFLGYNNSKYIYSEGNIYDCSYALERAEDNMLFKLKLKHLEALKTNYPSQSIGNDLKCLKEAINDEVVYRILDSFEYSKRGNKYSIRADDRTPSTKVYPSGYILDYGGFRGDIFSFLKEYHNLSFKDSIPFVKRFL